MATTLGDHDRVPVTPGLDTALRKLRLDGAIFFRAEYTEGWSYESPPPEDLAQVLHPGARRLIFFHIVAAGSCWIAIGDGEPHRAEAGDVIVLPYGDQHTVGGAVEAETVPILTLLDPPPWEALPVLRHGLGGARTDLVCGYLHCEDVLFDPSVRALPPVFVVRPPEGPAARWIRASIDFALAPGAQADPRLPELLLVEVLRLHLASATAAGSGWIAALGDPVLGPAVAALHAEPERKWTVTELAAELAVSRSFLDDRFRQVLGRSPIRYLTDWRMHCAEQLLATTALPVAAVARRVGYDSDEAFSRAFKRAFAVSPGARRARVARPAQNDADSRARGLEYD